MLGVEFLDGQGLGNQMFCLASVKSLALDNGYVFGTANQSMFAQNIHNKKGMFFMDVDLGEDISDIAGYNKYHEKDFCTGTVDYRTWYKISEIYVGVSRIAELT